MNEDPNSTVAILQALARALPPEAIDELWIFPPRQVGAGMSTVVVASAFERPEPAGPTDAAAHARPDVASAGHSGPVVDRGDVVASADPAAAPQAAGEAAGDDEVASDRRRIITASFTVARNPQRQPELRQELAEHGAAPADRVGRVVDGVFRRLEDEPEPPRHARIGGERDRWLELLAALAQQPGPE